MYSRNLKSAGLILAAACLALLPMGCKKAPPITLACNASAYPQALLQIADPPVLLYGMGPEEVWRDNRLNHASLTCVALVGSRNPTAQGADNARHFARALAQAGVTVVSGLAATVKQLQAAPPAPPAPSPTEVALAKLTDRLDRMQAAPPGPSPVEAAVAKLTDKLERMEERARERPQGPDPMTEMMLKQMEIAANTTNTIMTAMLEQRKEPQSADTRTSEEKLMALMTMMAPFMKPAPAPGAFQPSPRPWRRASPRAHQAEDPWTS